METFLFIVSLVLAVLASIFYVRLGRQAEATRVAESGRIAALGARKKSDEAHAAQLERLERERASLDARAHLPLAKELFEPMDNLARAMNALEDAQARAGFEAVERGFLRALEKHGVRPIDPGADVPYDPAQHEAIGVHISDQVSSPQVHEVLRAGWLHGEEQVLRPAMVQVAKPVVEAAKPEDEVVLDFSEGAAQEEEQAEEVAVSAKT